MVHYITITTPYATFPCLTFTILSSRHHNHTALWRTWLYQSLVLRYYTTLYQNLTYITTYKTFPVQNLTSPKPCITSLHRDIHHITLTLQHPSILYQYKVRPYLHRTLLDHTLVLRYITKPSPNCTYFTLHLLHTTFPCIAYTPHYPTSRNNTATAPRIV